MKGSIPKSHAIEESKILRVSKNLHVGSFKTFELPIMPQPKKKNIVLKNVKEDTKMTFLSV